MIIRAIEASNEADVIKLVNTYIHAWPYCRPIGPALLAHWKTLGESFQPENMLIGYRQGVARAFAHGERHGGAHNLHLLAVV